MSACPHFAFKPVLTKSSRSVGLPVTLRLITLLCLSLAFLTTARAANWHGIVPAQSDKKIVVAQLGKPKTETVDRMEFEDKAGSTMIFFYTLQDTLDLKLSSQLAGKVLTVYYYPKKPRTYDLNKLAKQVVAVGHGVTIDGEKMTSYDDGEHGISYHFKNSDTHVWRIVYYAPRKVFARYKLPAGK